MTIWKRSYCFHQFFWKLIFSTCSILSAITDPLVCVNVICLRELSKCFLYFFCRMSLFSDAWHSVHSSHLVGDMIWPLPIIKELSTLGNKIATELVVEKCIQTVHVFVVETEYIRFFEHFFNVSS